MGDTSAKVSITKEEETAVHLVLEMMAILQAIVPGDRRDAMVNYLAEKLLFEPGWFDGRYKPIRNFTVEKLIFTINSMYKVGKEKEEKFKRNQYEKVVEDINNIKAETDEEYAKQIVEITNRFNETV